MGHKWLRAKIREIQGEKKVLFGVVFYLLRVWAVCGRDTSLSTDFCACGRCSAGNKLIWLSFSFLAAFWQGKQNNPNNNPNNSTGLSAGSLGWHLWAGNWGRVKEFLHSGADFTGLQPLWDKNSPLIRFIPHLAICSWSLLWLQGHPGSSQPFWELRQSWWGDLVPWTWEQLPPVLWDWISFHGDKKRLPRHPDRELKTAQGDKGAFPASDCLALPPLAFWGVPGLFPVPL